MRCETTADGERFSADGARWFAALDAAVEAMPTGTPRERLERAVMAAFAVYRPGWAAAQRLPTLHLAREAALAADRKRARACQAAARRYRAEQLARGTAGTRDAISGRLSRS